MKRKNKVVSYDLDHTDSVSSCITDQIQEAAVSGHNFEISLDSLIELRNCQKTPVTISSERDNYSFLFCNGESVGICSSYIVVDILNSEVYEVEELTNRFLFKLGLPTGE